MAGKMYLLPSSISEAELKYTHPVGITEIVDSISYYIVENAKGARRFLIKAGISTPIDSLIFYSMNKKSGKIDFKEYLTPAIKGYNMAVISDAGVPSVADPGGEIVYYGHQNNISIVPVTGPSSIMMALMASGLNGQNFAFSGYLPIKRSPLIQKIKQLEKRSKQEQQTQIFMETPYRNQKLLREIINQCAPETYLTIAAGILSQNEFIKTKSVKAWKKTLPELHKIPAVFLLHKY